MLAGIANNYIKTNLHAVGLILILDDQAFSQMDGQNTWNFCRI
jgi:hypothetical protein